MQTMKMILIMTASFFISTSCAHDNYLPPALGKKSTEAQRLDDQNATISGETPQASEEKFNGLVISENSSEETSLPTSREDDTAGLPESLVLPGTHISKKNTYIQNLKATLKSFRKVAGDNRENEKGLNTEELRREADKYITIYVKPIINDRVAHYNFETKVEIAKLHLLIALLYSDVGRYKPAEHYLNLIDTRYCNHGFLLSLALDPADIGYSTLAEGIKALRKLISFQPKNN